MKHQSVLIRELEENEILPRLNQIETLQREVDTLQKAVSTLKGREENPEGQSKQNARESSPANYPGYPINGDLFEKLQFLEDLTLKVWTSGQVKNLILKAEGEDRGTKTLKSAGQKIHYFTNIGKLINLRYNNRKKYSFYTTRMAWLEKTTDGSNVTYRLLPEHEPEESFLEGLSEQQRSPDSITWSCAK